MMDELNWDLYFLRIAREVAKNSKCLSRKIGAVLIKDKSIISTGYNGPAKGVKHCDERPWSFYDNLGHTPTAHGFSWNQSKCPRRNFNYKSGEGLHLCQAGHAERNTLIQAARNGVSTASTTLYCFCGQVCKDCAIEIVNAGVRELVYLVKDNPQTTTNLGVYDNYAGVILQESGIAIRTVEERLL